MPASASISLTTAFAHRLIAVEAGNFAAWTHAVAALPGNPYGATVQRFGGSTAIAITHSRQPIFNRVFGFTAADCDHLPAILAFFRQHGTSPLFDLSPYMIEPYFVQPDGVFAALSRHGFYHAGWHQMLCAVPEAVPQPDTTPPHIEIIPVTDAAHHDALAAIFGAEKGAQDADLIRPLATHPAYRCFLACIEGQPAALGILHLQDIADEAGAGTLRAGSMANAVTLPAFRGRGCQTALLHHRIRVATQAGCDLLVSQCQPGSVSQRNQLRAGFQIAGTKAWWIPAPATGQHGRDATAPNAQASAVD